jgi:hypothetical protein
MPVPPSGKKPDGKKKKTWLWVLIGLVILGGLWYALTGSPSGVKAPKEENVEDTSMGTQVEGQPSFLWEFSPVAGNNETGAPRTKVTLSVGGEVREIGTYDGSCLVINGSSWTLAENELTGVICWFAGGGDEVGVFYENGAYVVKHGYLEEGVEGEAGMRGQYEELFSL